MGTILIIVLVILLLGGIPRSGSYNADWGYGPSGILGVILIIILVFYLLGHRF